MMHRPGASPLNEDVVMDMKDLQPDVDPQETQEWLEALDAVLKVEGVERAHFLLEQLIERARRAGANLPYKATTAYMNTIPPGLEERSPGDHELEDRIGGHIASFASAATLYDVGFNHFWRGADRAVHAAT
jgi:pyruvate dehydrogenase E1 component